MTVQAMKAGAIEFLTKPFRDQDLWTPSRTVLRAIAPAEKAKRPLMSSGIDSSRLPRASAIMIQATADRPNKQIAYGIGIAEATVKVHRSNLMRKMKARSQLSRMADKLGLAPEKPPRS
jgi:FixJ family two-component response regulator